MTAPRKQLRSSDSDAWEAAAEAWSRFIEAGDPFREQLVDPVVFGWLCEVRGKKILDAGCGEGYLARALAERGAAVIGIDGSAKLVEIAREKSRAEIEFREHDLREPFPFRDHTFDAVVCNLALMDFDPIEDAIREFNRVLVSSGTLVISLLHPSFMSGKAKGRLRKNVREFVLHKPPHHEILRYHTECRDAWHIQGVGVETAYYHRPLERYVRALRDAGFAITDLREPVFSKEFVRGKSNFIKLCAEVPPFLCIKARTHAD